MIHRSERRALARACVTVSLAAVAACSRASIVSPTEAGDARVDGLRMERDAARAAPEAGTDGTVPEAGPDVTLTTTALVRLANWSPDAPGIDLCIAPRGTSFFRGPILAGTLGTKALGTLMVVDLGPPFDAGAGASDAAAEATDAAFVRDAQTDAAPAPDARSDALVAHDGGSATGVPFPRLSPYVSLTPGEYDVRIVAAGAADCSRPLLPETDDLPALVAGVTETMALVGDTAREGTDAGLTLVAFPDDTTVPASEIGFRFINAVPSVAAVSFVAGTVNTGTAKPYLSAAQFGGAGVDTALSGLDANDYLITPPVENAVWSLINANGGVVTLASVGDVSLPAGSLATVVGVAGESGPSQRDIGILVCVDSVPVAAGEAAACKLYAATSGVCPHCP
jgi:hypothetical protein